MKNKHFKVIITSIILLLFIPVCRFIILPHFEKLPDNFYYSADISSASNFYDEAENRFSGDILSVEKFLCQAIDNDGETLTIKSTLDSKKPSGEKIFTAQRLYSVDRSTWQHVPGKGDAAQNGFLFGPKNADKSSFTYWHVNYNQPVLMKYRGEEKIAGLTVYRYTSLLKADQTNELSFLNYTPEKHGIDLDVSLTTWIDPFTGLMIKYEDQSTAWYYDISTKKRVRPCSKFHNQYTQSSIIKNIEDAKALQAKINFFKKILPVILVLNVIFISCLGFIHERSKKKLIPSFTVAMVLFIGFGLSFSVFYSQQNALHEKQIEIFEAEVSNVISKIKQEIDNSKAAMQILQLNSREHANVYGKEFYHLSQFIIQKIPGIQTLGYIPVIKDSTDRYTFEQQIGNKSVPAPGFNGSDTKGKLITTRQSGSYPPLPYTAHTTGSQKAPGFNTDTGHEYVISLDQVKNSFDFSITPPIKLSGDSLSEKSGVIIYNPIISTDTNGHSHIAGFLFGIYKTNYFIDHAIYFQNASNNINIKISDVTGSGKLPVFSNVDHASLKTIVATKQLQVFDRKWQLDFFAPEFKTEYSAWVLLFFGMLITMLTAMLVLRILSDNSKQAFLIQQRLDEAQTLSRLGNWEWDVVTDKVTWSEELYRILGISPNKFEPSYDGYINTIYPEDREIVDLIVKKAFGDHQPFDIIHRIMKKGSGDIRIIHCRGKVLVDKDNSILKMIGTSHDITELKNAEKEIYRYKKFFDNSTDIHSIISSDGSLRLISPVFSKLLGYTHDEIFARHFIKLVHPEDIKLMLEKFRLLRAGKSILNFNIRFQCKNKAYVHINTMAASDPETGEIYSISRDVTEQVILENKLLTLNADLEDRISKRTWELNMLLEHIQTSREDERKYIAREIHDELGQSLTALKIDVSMVKKKLSGDKTNHVFLSDELASIINKIDGSINSVKRIATDLRPEILDHLDIIEAIKWQVQQFKNITGVQCVLTTEPETASLPAVINTAVYRIIQEALTNITRHAKAQKVSISLKIVSNEIFIEVKDDGIGFDHQMVKKSKSLGLLGIRERIRLLNGNLSINTISGKGTSITVNLPLETGVHTTKPEPVILNA